jgi:hypothetical protein
VVVTATPQPAPQAVINSPNGFLNVRSGPGIAYVPPIGNYNNGAVVAIIGKQVDRNGDLWWLVRFGAGSIDQGWIFADYTEATNIEPVPWVPAPPLPTPTAITPQPTPTAFAIIDSPAGFLAVRPGPGQRYEPPLGYFNNGTSVAIIGKQVAVDDGSLWWLVPFANSATGWGWIFANHTIARYINNVPWVAAPPTPTRPATNTPTATPTPTPTPTTTTQPKVTWSISGQVTDVVTLQPVAGVAVRALLGVDGTTLVTVTDSTGRFSLAAEARNEGDLTLTLTAPGYVERNVVAGPLTPRIDNFPRLELTPSQAPTITWAIFGRVVELGNGQPLPGVTVEAVLGDEAIKVQTLTDQNGQFDLRGNARDSGRLTININVPGFQPFTVTPEQVDSRIYNLGDLRLVPLAASCLYESVINLTEAAALARLQSLSFTQVATKAITVQNQALLGRVLTQDPIPPPEGQTARINCQLPIRLDVGVAGQVGP